MDAPIQPSPVVDDNVIQAGSPVIFDNGELGSILVVAKRGDKYQNRNGLFFHDSFIGKQYGTKVHIHRYLSY